MRSDGGIELSTQLESKSDEDDTLQPAQSLRDQGRGSESRTFGLTSARDNDPRIALAEAVGGPGSRARDMRYYDDNDPRIALAEAVVGPEMRARDMLRTRYDGNNAKTAFAEPLTNDGENGFRSKSIGAVSATNLANKKVRLWCSVVVFACAFNAYRSRCSIYRNSS